MLKHNPHVFKGLSPYSHRAAGKKALWSSHLPTRTGRFWGSLVLIPFLHLFHQWHVGHTGKPAALQLPLVK